MVTRTRLELVRLAAPPPQSGASTNFATWANNRVAIATRKWAAKIAFFLILNQFEAKKRKVLISGIYPASYKTRAATTRCSGASIPSGFHPGRSATVTERCVSGPQ